MRQYFEALRSIAGRFGALVALRQVDSTNALARRLSRAAGHPAATMLVSAWEQIGGRGREGRVWESPPGAGVYASLALPLGGGLEVERLPFAVPVAIAEVIERELGLSPGLKWPNDLLLKGKKLGGILIETVSRRTPMLAIVGFGVNVRSRPGRSEAAALEAHLETAPEIGALTALLAVAIRERFESAEPTADLVRDWSARSIHELGDALRCKVGARVVEGEFAGFDASGALRLNQQGSVVTVAAGELVVAEPGRDPAC